MRSNRFLSYVLIALCTFAALGQASASIVRVKWDSPNNGPGNDWDHAFQTVAAGLNAAVSGDEVWVAAGTYVARITVNAGVGLYGGFAGGESTRDARNWSANMTILDGGGHGTVVTASGSPSQLATIDGFTIRNGQSGVTCSSARIAHSTIKGIRGGTYGGGIHCSGSSCAIANNVITGNGAYYGGGIWCSSSSSVIANNVIAGNGASYGGGIHCDGCSPVITGNTIAGNVAGEGGGISCVNGSSPAISNSIVALNSSGIYSNGNGASVLRHNDVYNPAGYDYSGLSVGAGDISADPRFASAQYGNYHVQPDSPCVGAGWNDASGIGSADIDGQPRILPAGGAADIGADESDGTPWNVVPVVVRVDGVGGNDANDGSSWTLAKKTVQGGISAASASGGEAWVKAGIYNERITLQDYAYVYGGFAGTESTRAARNRLANTTILDGGGSSSASVVAALGIGLRLATIDGFTIRNSKYAGVYCAYASPSISNNTITGCTGTSRGVIYCLSASPLILNNWIVGNAGSGVYCQSGAAIISNNTIAGNYSEASPQSVVYCASGSPILSNNIIALNSSGIYISTGSTPVLRNNDVFNPGGTDYSYVSAGVGDISIDPKFVSYVSGDYHIQPGSPCIDAGWNEAPGIGATDMDGQPRILPVGGTVDIGADESDGTVWDDTLPLVVRVDGASGSDANDGSSWLLAKKTVQAGIDVVSASVGEVWVKAGTYNERITLRTNAFLYGGFAGTESTRGARNWSANATILDGGGLGTVVTAASDILWGHAAIDGFTIRNGKATNGGGICLSNSSLAISNNTIMGSTASYAGGGIYCTGNCSVTISGNTITGNTSVDGGGIYARCAFGTTAISSNAISGNTASHCGGGVSVEPGQYPNMSFFAISNNTISANNADSGGGGVYFGTWTEAMLSDNVIKGNCSNASGGGLYCSYCCPTISNNTLLYNTGGIYLTYWPASLASTKISNNIIAFNSFGVYNSSGSPTLRNNNVYNPNGSNYTGLSPGAGDISADPLFVSTMYGDFHIQPDSPCRNAGWNEAPSIGLTDIDGQRRVQPTGGAVDIGADESDGIARPVPPTVVVRVDGANGSDSNDGSAWLLAKRTVQAAIDAAAALGGEVWVKAGAYSERVKLRSFAYLFGGFAGHESSKSERDWTANKSALDGGNAGSVVTCLAYGQVSCVDGFTIRNGKAANGGGIYCAASSPAIANNVITGNNATADGGGIYCTASSFATISGNLLVNNTASGRGGGIGCNICPVTISSNTIVSNTALLGGGIYCFPSALQICNNTVAFNSSGLFCYPGVTLRNNDVYNPGGTDYYYPLPPGIGDISLDPLFVNRAAGDYHLAPGSPCINAGWNDALGMPALDLDGEPRVRGGTIDIGLDERWPGIADAKTAAGGAPIEMAAMVVSAAFPDFFYIEQPNRAAGIRVEKPSHGVSMGSRVTLSGTVNTNADGERCVAASSIAVSGVGSVLPIALSNSALGGGAFGLQGPVWGWRNVLNATTGRSELAWMESAGLNNIGLLVRICGRFTKTSDTTFTLDDGSNLQVKCTVYGGVTLDDSWTYISVTGISSCEKVGDELHRVLIVRNGGDIVPM